MGEERDRVCRDGDGQATAHVFGFRPPEMSLSTSGWVIALGKTSLSAFESLLECLFNVDIPQAVGLWKVMLVRHLLQVKPLLCENFSVLSMAWGRGGSGARGAAAGLWLPPPCPIASLTPTAWDPPKTPSRTLGKGSPPPVTHLLPLPVPSNSSAESLDRLYPAVGSSKPPRKRTTSQCKSEPPLLRTSKRTIYTAGRPPWYNEHGTQSKEAFVIGRGRQRVSRLCPTSALQPVMGGMGSIGAACPGAPQEILGGFLPHNLLGNSRLSPGCGCKLLSPDWTREGPPG